MQTDPGAAKICIYTAIYGGYEKLLAQPQQTLDCDFVCFTDDPNLSGEGWTVIHLPCDPALSPRMQSQSVKLAPDNIFVPANFAHLLDAQPPRLPLYDYTIWIDANAVIKKETFAAEVLGYLDKFGIAAFPHPDRDCIYEEAEACLQVAKYQVTPMSEQAAYYRSEGCPEHNGLFASGLIARDMHRPEVSKVSAEWCREAIRWSTIDQVSLPYVLWKNNYGCDVIKHYLWSNDLIRWEGHYSQLIALYEKRGMTPQAAGTPEGKCEGYIEVIDCELVAGWVWNPALPETPVLIDIYDGAKKLCTKAADTFRADLVVAGKGNGVHAFVYHIPDSLRDGQPHSIWIGISGTPDSLNKQNPTVITCSPR